VKLTPRSVTPWLTANGKKKYPLMMSDTSLQFCSLKIPVSEEKSLSKLCPVEWTMIKTQLRDTWTHLKSWPKMAGRKMCFRQCQLRFILTAWWLLIPLSWWLSEASRCRVQQYFMYAFFVWECFAQFFSNYSFDLMFLDQRISAQKLFIKCWRNWLQVSISPIFCEQLFCMKILPQSWVLYTFIWCLYN